MFAGLYALEVLPARISVFFHAFKSLERLPKLATSYSCVVREAELIFRVIEK